MSETTCEEFRDLSAELALGVADARDRAAAFAHLEHCATCRLRLRELNDVADALSSLTPAVEPPVGFETRILAHLDAATGTSEPNDRVVPIASVKTKRRGPLFAAVAAAALVVGTFGFVVGDQTSRPTVSAAGHVVIAKLTADQQPVGQVVVQTRSEPWISMAVALGNGNDKVQCQLRTADGRILTIGWFTLSRGYGYWAAPISAPTKTVVDAAQVADPNGHVLARAPLPSVRLAPTADA